MIAPVPDPRLTRLKARDLRRLHAEGRPPDLTDLRGALDGVVLNGVLDHRLLRSWRLWRGKVFEPSTTHDHPDDATAVVREVAGYNRLGCGPAEVRRFLFHARLAPSRFADREVVVLDHENDANPAVVRRFHDELVQVDDGLYLATSHHRSDLGPDPHLRFVCHFALSSPHPVGTGRAT